LQTKKKGINNATIADLLKTKQLWFIHW
jgi:hypothetical protein